MSRRNRRRSWGTLKVLHKCVSARARKHAITTGAGAGASSKALPYGVVESTNEVSQVTPEGKEGACVLEAEPEDDEGRGKAAMHDAEQRLVAEYEWWVDFDVTMQGDGEVDELMEIPKSNEASEEDEESYWDQDDDWNLPWAR